MSTVITVENLGKKYLLKHQSGQQPYVALRDVLSEGVRNLGRKLLGHDNTVSRCTESEDFWALKDVSFEVKQGDRIGIIGRNGAGKSTLLKVLSRITEPTAGSVRIRGRVASLLEVGTGFHPELTGRENIYLNGAILGMSRAEIRKKFDEIVDFAEIERFLDTPVKRYSSGMYVRLAFAVAAHLEPEILVVDEVLAVGDAQFQKKCLGKMEEVSAREGRTVLFVSHNMGAIKQLCHNGVLLDKGRTAQIGTVDAITRGYLLETINRNPSYENSFHGTLAGNINITGININSNTMDQVLVDNGEDIKVVVTGHCLQQINNLVFSFSVFKDDVRVFTQHDCLTPKMLHKGDFKAMVTFPRYVLRPGEYNFAFGGHDSSSKDWFFGTGLKYFIVGEAWTENNVAINYGLVNVECVDSYRISNGERIC